MDEAGYVWREASVTFPDFQGTAQLDRRVTGAGVESKVGLDPSEWLIVGFYLGGGENRSHLNVVAVNRALFPDGGDVLPKIAEANGGEIPVTEFRDSRRRPVSGPKSDHPLVRAEATFERRT
jgi:hypothetical protein